LSISTSTDIATIERAGQALIEAVASPAKVVLFGPHAGGGGSPGADYKFLVIAAEVDDRFGEAARLDKLLGRLLIPADVIVVSGEEADRPQAKGTVIHEALTTGRVIVES
jgi:uncharacterized protein